MPLSQVIVQTLASPYVIGAAIFMLVYGSLVARVASGKERTHRAPPPQKPGRPPKPPKEEAALDKTEDTSELELE